MAADTRPYKSKEQDGQGNEVIIRDQQLVEQSTVTTMPSGACFETFDIDGRPVKIPRDNMISIVLECMGIVLNDSSKNLGTNVNKALGLQGNTIGNVTVSDLASVLGANPKIKIIKGYVDSNTTQALGLTDTQSGFIWFSDNNTPDAVYKIPYYGTFETVVNGMLKFARTTSPGDVTITTTGTWTSYIAIVTKANVL